MLKMTKVELELLTDNEMIMMFQKGITGGLSQVTKRKVILNNKYLPDYNTNDITSYLASVDANNLYGDAMSNKLPYKDFKWCTEEEINNFEINDNEALLMLSNDDDTGYTFEIDGYFPDDVHTYLKDYPPLPHKLSISKEMHSPFQKKFTRKHLQTPKLIASLLPREKQVLDYRLLKQAIQLGFKVTKIHRIIKYTQGDWLKKYVDFMTEKRKKATSEVKISFFKLMVNVIYGRLILNVFKFQDVKIVTNKVKAEKFICKPTFKKFTLFNEHLVAIHMNKQEVMFKNPIYAGFSILQMSKYIMYDIYYNYFKKKYNDKVENCMTDTDSFALLIHTDDFYEDIRNDIPKMFDTSKMKNNQWKYPIINKNKLGCIKIETDNDVVKKFIGLQAKTYIYEYGNEKKQAQKGIPKRKQNTIEDYEYILNNQNEMKKISFYKIQSEKIEDFGVKLYTKELSNKISLTAWDDKNYICDDGINTLPWGHKDIPTNN